MNRLLKFFKRLFEKFNKEEVVQPPVVTAPQTDPKDVNYLAWRAYQDELDRTRVFPTTEAAPRSNVIPEVMLETPEGNIAKARAEYLANLKPDLTPEQLAMTATKRDNSQLPDPPYFVFVGNRTEMLIFNELVKSESQAAAYRYLMTRAWNAIGQDFREQASKYFDSGLINRIINTYSSGGGGRYFKS